MPAPDPVRDPEMSSALQLMQELQAGAMRAAPALIGCFLERDLPSGLIRARIVETEAYTRDDPASHSFTGLTIRNQPMFGPAGTAYVYTSYGIHRCLNVVTGEIGAGEAVLIRALEPVAGIEYMLAARRWLGKPVAQLANGPGKICEALSVGLDLNGLDLMAGGGLRLIPGHLFPDESIQITHRIGITKAADWPRRFILRSIQPLSRKR